MAFLATMDPTEGWTSSSFAYPDNDTFPSNTTPGNMSVTSCTTLQPTLFIITQFMWAIICITGLLGNTLVIYVVLRFSKMQTVTNTYIVNLAVADECFLIGIPFLLITIYLQYWPFGKIMCKAYMTTTSMNQFTSSIFLTIMSADRYIAVCHPITSPKMRTPFISKVVSATAWTVSALLVVPVFVYSNLMEGYDASFSCIILWPESGSLPGQTAFTLYSFTLGYAVPLILIFIFYFPVIRKLKTVGPKNQSKEKVTKLVLTVSIVYFLCWTPYWATQMALIFTPPSECQSPLSISMFLLSGIVVFSNSAMNPILYAFLSDNFKKSFVKACTCKTGLDINATLRMENSVFLRRHKQGSEKHRPTRGHSPCPAMELDDGERPLVSKADHSTTALTATSRSNMTVNPTRVYLDRQQRTAIEQRQASFTPSSPSDRLQQRSTCNGGCSLHYNMEGASGSGDPSLINRKVIINAQRLFDVLYDKKLDQKDKLEQIKKLLISDEINLNFPDEQYRRNTLLHGAVFNGYDEIVKLLLFEKKADGSTHEVDVNIQNAEGDTPLHIAVLHGSARMIQMLLGKKKAGGEQKADVNIQNAKLETPLHLVFSERCKNRKAIITMLLTGKAGVNIKNSNEKTPLELAEETKEKSIIDMLSSSSSMLSSTNIIPQVVIAPCQNKNTGRANTSRVETKEIENKVPQAPNAFSNFPEKYGTSGAKHSMHGTIYQLCLLMLFAIRASVKRRHFRLGTEVDTAEQFDDLVFRYQLPDSETYKTLLLQAKSKADVTKEIDFSLLLEQGNNDQFSLLKYYKSYIKIKQSQEYMDDNIDFVICTNTHFKFDLPGKLKGKNGNTLSFKRERDILEGFFNEGECYKLVVDDETLNWLKNEFEAKLNSLVVETVRENKNTEALNNLLRTLNDIKTLRAFFNNLVFVVHRGANIELVKAELRIYLKTNLLDIDLLTDAFYNQMFDWFSMKDGVWLSNEKVEEMIGTICKKINIFATSIGQVYAEKLRKFPIKFVIGNLDKLNALISKNKIVHLITPVETKLSLLHVAQALECSSVYKEDGFIFMRLSSLLLSDTQKLTISAFELPRNNNLLAIDCLSKEDDLPITELTTLLNMLRKITDENSLKKIILIAPKDHAFAKEFRLWPEYYPQHVKYVFEDFTEETRDVFLSTKITFQGDSMQLNEFIKSNRKRLEIVSLEKLIGDEGLVIGTAQATSPGYIPSCYIER